MILDEGREDNYGLKLKRVSGPKSTFQYETENKWLHINIDRVVPIDREKGWYNLLLGGQRIGEVKIEKGEILVLGSNERGNLITEASFKMNSQSLKNIVDTVEKHGSGVT